MTEENLRRSPELMHRDESALLVVDLQERLLTVQPQGARIIWNARRLLEGAAALGVQTAATEQVPDKLGPTADSLKPYLSVIEAKQAFSSAVCTSLLDQWRDANVRHIVLTGIETHVCIQQTVLDLIAESFEPKVVVDAVGSRFDIDHKVALRRLESSGAVLTTTEAVLFEWCETSADPAFKKISNLAKETWPE